LIVAIVFDDRVANRNALIADISSWVVTRGGDELAYDVLAFVTERTAKGIVRSGAFQAGSPRKLRVTRSVALINGHPQYISTISILCPEKSRNP
jgi:hypothetical protein